MNEDPAHSRNNDGPSKYLNSINNFSILCGEFYLGIRTLLRMTLHTPRQTGFVRHFSAQTCTHPNDRAPPLQGGLLPLDALVVRETSLKGTCTPRQKL